MFEFIIGVAVGAAFAPFWMIVYNKAKDFITTSTTPKQ